MCAIIDANVIHEVFGKSSPDAGKEFLYWVNCGRGRLVAGGKLLNELENASGEFKKWALQAKSSGKIRFIEKDQVNAQEQGLRHTPICSSNDSHIIALAQVSGARLLYSNDKKLQQDFKNKELIDNPRGKVYSTNQGREIFTDRHRRLLARRDLCQLKP